jgi:sigma-E factor negative regulatory protein RseB
MTAQSSLLVKTATLLLALSLQWNVAYAGPSDWLMKINKAAAEVNFSGNFVYIHDGKIEAMEVARRIRDGLMQERIYSLNGEPREIIRGMDKVWCYIPDQNVVVHDYRQISASGFPRILPGDIAQLEKNYHFMEGVENRIANRRARQIRVIPNDGYRYGYDLWADTETGLLLRSDLVNMEEEIVEQYLFVSIRIGGEIADSELEPVSNSDDLQLFGNSAPFSTPVENSIWNVTNVPDGFRLSMHIRRMSPMDAGEVEHMVFTDGLSTVSVFIKEANKDQSEMTGPSKMGAVHAYRRTVENHRITVMGEVPAKTVKYLAMGVEVSS